MLTLAVNGVAVNILAVHCSLRPLPVDSVKKSRSPCFSRSRGHSLRRRDVSFSLRVRALPLRHFRRTSGSIYF